MRQVGEYFRETAFRQPVRSADSDSLFSGANDPNVKGFFEGGIEKNGKHIKAAA